MTCVDSLFVSMISEKFTNYEPTLLYKSKYQICPYCNHVLNNPLNDDMTSTIQWIFLGIIMIFVICIILTTYYYIKDKK